MFFQKAPRPASQTRRTDKQTHGTVRFCLNAGLAAQPRRELMPAPRLPRRTGRVHTVPLGHLHGRVLTAAALTPAPA